MPTKEKEITELPENVWGVMGYRLFLAFLNLLNKAHYFFLGYYVPKYTYLTAKEGFDGEIIQINLEEVLTVEPINVFIIGTIVLLVAIIIIFCIVIFIKNRSLNRYKEKVGELEKAQILELDNDRGSSNLTNTGKTNPEDLP